MATRTQAHCTHKWGQTLLAQESVKMGFHCNRFSFQCNALKAYFVNCGLTNRWKERETERPLINWTFAARKLATFALCHLIHFQCKDKDNKIFIFHGTIVHTDRQTDTYALKWMKRKERKKEKINQMKYCSLRHCWPK